MKIMIVTSRLRSATASALAIALLLAGCNDVGSKVASSAPVQVDVAEVRLTDVKIWDEFNGRVSAVDSVEIRPRVTGYITEVAYTEGSAVKKGDLLFVIDPRPYRAALEHARAQLARAAAALHLAKQQNARAQSLFSTKAASREEAEEKRAALDTTLSELRAAESSVAIATLDLEFTNVRSPIDGRTSRARLTVGNLAVADQSMLTSVVSQHPIHVYFDPDEHSFLRYRAALHSAGAGGATLTARVGLADGNGFPYEGVVSFIDNHVNPNTGTIQARAIVDNADHALTSGLFARVRFSTGNDVPTLLIDDRAILTDQNRKFVYVVDPEDKVARRDVEPGRMIRDLRVIESGLQPGERIVVAGMQRIFAPGTSVSPTVVRMELASDPAALVGLANAAPR